MKSIVYDTVSFPTWALSALINGDISGIEEFPEDVKMVENFEQRYNDLAKQEGYTDVIFNPDDNQYPFFTWNPVFGLACECIPLTIHFLK